MKEAEPYSIYDDPLYKRHACELKFLFPRIVVNGLFTASDFAPGYVPGEAGSIAADIAKSLRLGIKFLGFKIRFFDPTPDVDWSGIATEGLEVFGGGSVPTHAIESVIQLHYDRQRLMRFGRVQWRAFRGTSHEDIRDFLYESSKNDRLFEDLYPKKAEPLSDLSAQEILDLVPKPLPFA